ncbi:HAD-IA family hydrolase [Pleionea litopenaei]|uniref:HAD-IA family hydrolase n=1 Tax=Pleionea litopenaei TaxID=3070815 RepID=A0AA51RTD2_9GAMM|nr:HAD-IA family hydrolase [Pleionea sp. HL-JVS1]WMS87227.1 HAD-IA family hydrolase [Pleionea sp. HL-JVS1]
MTSSKLYKPKAVLFDLDGTLADTGPDLAFALNELLIAQGRSALSYDTIRPWVSKGAPGLLKLGFSIDESHSDYRPLRERFLTLYQRNICRHTRIFEPLNDFLAEIHRVNICWGIITNKPAFLTDLLLPKLEFHCPPAVVFSGDTFSEKKPHPMPLLEASKQLEIAPEDCFYVGDDERDMIAAKAAGMTAIAALWGYIPEQEDPSKWAFDSAFTSPDAFYNAVKELLK